MRFVKKCTIYDPGLWGSYDKSFASSPDGQLIAVRSMDAGNVWEDERNVFVYNTDGHLLWSLGNCFGGGNGTERGIEFWPDKYHILIPGCDPGIPDLKRDGLKNYKIGSSNCNDYILPFHDTPVNGIRCNLIGVSNSGRYVLATQGYNYCIDTSTKCILTLPKVFRSMATYYQTSFSKDEKYVAFERDYVYHDVIIELPTGNVLWDSNAQNTHLFLCFSSDDHSFLCYQPTNRSGLALFDLESSKEVTRLSCSEDTPLDNYANNNDLPYSAIYSNLGEFLITIHSSGKMFMRNANGIVASTKIDPGFTRNRRLKLKLSSDDSELIAVNGESAIVWKIEM